MTISPVFTGAPADERCAVEQQTYTLLEELHIPYTRVDHDEAATMDGANAITGIRRIAVAPTERIKL